MTSAEARALADEIERSDVFSYVRSVLQATDSQGRPIVEVVDLLTTARHQVASPAQWQQLHARLRGTARGMAHGPQQKPARLSTVTPVTRAPADEGGPPLAPLAPSAPSAGGCDPGMGETFLAFVDRALVLATQRRDDLLAQHEALATQIADAKREAAALDAARTAFARALAASPRALAGARGGRARMLVKPPGMGPFPARWEPIARAWAAAHDGVIDLLALAKAESVPPSRLKPVLERLVRRGQAAQVDTARYALVGDDAEASESEAAG